MSDNKTNNELDLISYGGITAATITDILSETKDGLNLKLSLPISSGVNAPVLITIKKTVKINAGDDILFSNLNVRRLTINNHDNLKKVYKGKIGKSEQGVNTDEWTALRTKIGRLLTSGVSGLYYNNEYIVIHRTTSKVLDLDKENTIVPKKGRKNKKDINQPELDFGNVNKGTGQHKRTLNWIAKRFQELEGMMGDTHITTPLRPIDFDFENNPTMDEDTKKIVETMQKLSRVDTRKILEPNDFDILLPVYFFGLNKDREQISSIVSEIRQGGQKSITPSSLERSVLSPRYVQFSSVKDNPLTFWQQANQNIGKYFFPKKLMSSEGCTRFLTLHELGHSVQRGFGMAPSYIETRRDEEGKVQRYKSQTFDIDRHREELFADCFAILSLIIDFNDRETPALVRQLRATQMFNAETNLQTSYYMTAPAIAEAINMAEKILKDSKESGKPISMYEIGNTAASLATKWCDNLQEPMNDFFEENSIEIINPQKDSWDSFLKKAKWDESLDPHFKEFKEALANLYGAKDLNKKQNIEKFQGELEKLIKDVKEYGINNALPVGERAFWLFISTTIPEGCSQESKEKIQAILQQSFIEGADYTKRFNYIPSQYSGWVAPSSEAFSKPLELPKLPKTKKDFLNEKEAISEFKGSMRLLSRHMKKVNDIAPNLYDGKKKDGFLLTKMNKEFNLSTHYVMAIASDLYMTFERAEEIGMLYSDIMSDKTMIELYEILPILIDLRVVMGKHENNTEGRNLRIKYANLFNSSVQEANETIQKAERLFIPEEELFPPPILDVEDQRSSIKQSNDLIL